MPGTRKSPVDKPPIISISCCVGEVNSSCIVVSIGWVLSQYSISDFSWSSSLLKLVVFGLGVAVGFGIGVAVDFSIGALDGFFLVEIISRYGFLLGCGLCYTPWESHHIDILYLVSYVSR